jgi:diguanylate cyclase
MCRDISERRAKDKSLARALRALRTLSAGNGVLLQAATESDLLGGVCQVTVDAGYRMASVGYIDQASGKTIGSVACAAAARFTIPRWSTRA